MLIVYVANPSRIAGARPHRHVITAWWGMLVGKVAAASPGTAGEEMAIRSELFAPLYHKGDSVGHGDSNRR